MARSAKVVPLKRAKPPRKLPVSGTVPNRKANDALRTRSHLTEKEVEGLLKVAKQGRYGQRDHPDGVDGLSAWAACQRTL